MVNYVLLNNTFSPPFDNGGLLSIYFYVGNANIKLLTKNVSYNNWHYSSKDKPYFSWCNHENATEFIIDVHTVWRTIKVIRNIITIMACDGIMHEVCASSDS